MSRKVLALVSGISERCGDGNVSVKLLRRVAAAMGTRIEDLLVDRPVGQDWPIFRDLLGAASPAQVARARCSRARRRAPSRRPPPTASR
jgi:XRE family aerobic/anaerobic benzoate catabolism transcriptional regulator